MALWSTKLYIVHFKRMTWHSFSWQLLKLIDRIAVCFNFLHNLVGISVLRCCCQYMQPITKFNLTNNHYDNFCFWKSIKCPFLIAVKMPNRLSCRCNTIVMFIKKCFFPNEWFCNNFFGDCKNAILTVIHNYKLDRSRVQ